MNSLQARNSFTPFFRASDFRMGRVDESCSTCEIFAEISLDDCAASRINFLDSSSLLFLRNQVGHLLVQWLWVANDGYVLNTVFEIERVLSEIFISLKFRYRLNFNFAQLPCIAQLAICEGSRENLQLYVFNYFSCNMQNILLIW